MHKVPNPFYLSRLWKAIRGRKLRQQPLCEYCMALPRLRPATQVDHYVPINQGGSATDMSNLRSACASCHSAKTRGSDQNGGLDVFRRGCGADGVPRVGWNYTKKVKE